MKTSLCHLCVESYMQLFDFYGNCNNFFYHDWNTCLHWKSFTPEASSLYVKIDLESKDEHSPEQAIPSKILVIWIYFTIQIICNYAYQSDHGNKTNNFKANAKSRLTTEEHLRDILQKGSLINQYLENCCSHFLCYNFFLPSSDSANGPTSGARQIQECDLNCHDMVLRSWWWPNPMVTLY